MVSIGKADLRPRSCRARVSGWHCMAFVLISLLFAFEIPAVGKSVNQLLKRTSRIPKFLSTVDGQPSEWLVPRMRVTRGRVGFPVLPVVLDSHRTSLTTPEWMQEPLFHSPRVLAADYAQMKQKLKIYFYPYPANETKMFGFHPQERIPGGNYASESYFFRNLHETEMRTNDPNEAHFFVLPFSVFKVRMAIGPTLVPEFVGEYMEETLKRKWPYWNRTAGADHLYGTCHDLGVSAASQSPGVSGSAIQIVCAANRWHRNYIPTKDFSLPQIWPRYDSEPGGLSAAERKASNVLAFWSGAQNSRARAFLKETWEDDDEILLGGGRVLRTAIRGMDYYSNFRKAKYCLHVSGYQVPTARIGDAIYFGCVPVILSDQYDLPFKDVVDWTEFSVIVAEQDIPNLKKILKSIPDGKYEKLHANVQIIRRLFIWHSPPEDYDIFHMTAYDLWLRRFVTRPSLDFHSVDQDS